MGLRHDELLQRYEQLSIKYKAAVQAHSHAYSLGHFLLRHSDEGVALLRDGRLAAANRRFYDFCSGAQGWSDPGQPTPPGGQAPGEQDLLALLISLASQVPEPSPSDSSLRVRLINDRGGQLAASLQRTADPLGQIAIILRDVSDEQALQQEQREGERRDEFLAMLAHELRNPLTAILGAAQMVLKKPDGPRVREAAGVIKRQAEHQARLVGELLDTARVRQGKIVLHNTRLDLRHVLQEAAESTESLRGHGVTLSLQLPERPVELMADRTRMLQCVTNLLANAAKFTEPGGHNRLSLEARDIAWIRVADTGIGMDAEILPRIFDLFSQADRSLARSGGGLGLGLALTRRLVEMHGGGVRVHSEGLGKGSEFTIWLPIPAIPDSPIAVPPADSPAPAEPAAPAAVLATTQLRVLLVEDNEYSRESLGLLLQDVGHTVFLAQDGKEGLELALREHPDLVISDLGLPVMDGLTLSRRLHEARPGLPLIALSGYSGVQERERARAAGFCDYLVKPILSELLLAAIEKNKP